VTDGDGVGPGPLRVCFVCTGNICRSPIAEVVLRSMAAGTVLDGGATLADHLVVDSAGTGNWHAGEPMDPRAAAALAGAGYPDHGHRARAFEAAWFDELDLVVALARTHQQTLAGLARRRAGGGEGYRERLVLLRSYDPRAGGSVDVPDPYYGDGRDFEACLALVEAGCRGLADDLARRVATRPGQPAGGPNVTSDSAS
jgi:protein-tyrosine phosphatase